MFQGRPESRLSLHPLLSQKLNRIFEALTADGKKPPFDLEVTPAILERNRLRACEDLEVPAMRMKGYDDWSVLGYPLPYPQVAHRAVCVLNIRQKRVGVRRVAENVDIAFPCLDAKRRRPGDPGVVGYQGFQDAKLLKGDFEMRSRYLHHPCSKHNGLWMFGPNPIIGTSRFQPVTIKRKALYTPSNFTVTPRWRK